MVTGQQRIDLSRRIAVLSPEKRQLFERRVAGQAKVDTDKERLERTGRLSPLPLSSSQERMWFLEHLHPTSGMYNVPITFRVRGALDISAMHRVCQALVDRHEALRTSFVRASGVPIQIVRDSCELSIATVDLDKALPHKPREALIQSLIDAEVKRPFDLARPPLFRVTLIRADSLDSVVVVVMHHIVSDAWSLAVLWSEAILLYDSTRRGEPASLPPLAVQYGDFTVWQRNWLAGSEASRQLDYWRSRLQGVKHMELPARRTRRRSLEHSGAAVTIHLSPDVVRKIRDLARSESATPFMVLLTALGGLLSRYGNTSDVIIGAPVSQRYRPEWQRVVGLFLNTLALRNDLSGDPTLRDALRRVRDSALRDYAHQDVPFEQVVEAVQPRRDSESSPFFNVMLTLESGMLPTLRGSDVELEGNRPVVQPPKFDWLIAWVDNGGELAGRLEYDPERFAPQAMSRASGHLKRLLEAMACAPDTRLSEVEILSQRERHQLLVRRNDTAKPRTSLNSLIDILNDQIRRRPNAVAVESGQHRMSYEELGAASSRVACILEREGVGAETPVGLYTDRDCDMVIAILGILQVGAVCVPLDPSFPPDRLAFMAEDAGLQVVLTQQSLRRQADRLGRDIQWLCMEDIRHDPKPGARLNLKIHREQLAYILYTSGSSGFPKGVAMPHGVLINLLEWHDRALAGGKRVLQFSSVSFDASFHEMFSAWKVGGSIVLITEEESRDVVLLLRKLASLRVEKVTLPVAVLRRVASEALRRRTRLRSLRTIMSTGDALVLTDDVAHWLRISAAKIHNHYGPSETHVVTAHTLDPKRSRCVRCVIPIGRPIDNCRVYVVGADFGLAAEGGVGELWIGGLPVSRGYWRRPKLTAARFVPDPFATDPGSRAYRTGDLVRWNSNGDLEFLGRMDNQLKIRGIRVEPGEVEAILEAEPSVQQCAVVPKAADDGDAERQLLAYMVAAEGTEKLSAVELIQRLRRRLPEAFIPSAFFWIDSLVVTPTGKIDRRQLAQLAGQRAQVGTDYSPPQSACEEMLKAVWKSVLEGKEMGIDDDFFALGGHSLLAMQVTAQLYEMTGIDVPVRVLFELPTIRLLAEWIDESRRN